MKCKSKYKDMEKYRLYANRNRKKSYDKTAIYGRNAWTQEQERMVLERSMTDEKLSAVIHHSAASIQKKRWELLHFDENGNRIKKNTEELYER